MHVCHGCGHDYAGMGGEKAEFSSAEVHRLFDDVLISLSGPIKQAGKFDLGFFSVLHQLCSILVSLSNRGRLEQFICRRLGTQFVPRTRVRLPIEGYSLNDRHHLIQYGLWLMGSLALRLGDAWTSKAVRYNHLLKDFEDAPTNYRNLVGRYSDWRKMTSPIDKR